MAFSLSKVNIRQYLDRYAAKRLLVLVVEEFAARGVVVEKGAGTTLRLVSFREETFDVSRGSLRVVLSKFFEGFEEKVGDVLVVSEEVQYYQMFVPLPSPKAVKNLTALATVELTSYLPGAAAEYEIFSRLATEQEVEHCIVEEEGIEKRLVIALAAPRQLIGSLQSALKGYRMRLAGVVGSEIAAWSLCSESVAGSGCFVVAEWKRFEIVAGYMHEGDVLSVLRETINAGDSPLGIVKEMAQSFAKEFGRVDEIIVGGEMAEEAESDIEGKADETAIKVWSSRQELPFVEAGEVPPRYMNALAAAVNMTGEKPRRFFVDTSITFSELVRSNIYALPLIILGAGILLTGAEYLHMSGRRNGLEKRIEVLERKKEELEKEAGRDKSMLSRYNDARKEAGEFREKCDLLAKGMVLEQAKLSLFLDGVVDVTPPDVQLRSIRQFSDEMFYLEGEAQSAQSGQLFSVRLKEIDHVEEVKIERNEEVAESGKERSRRKRHSFVIRVRVKS